MSYKVNFLCRVTWINLLKKANGEIFNSASVDKCHQKATFVQKCSENKCLKGWNTLRNQKGKIPKINQNHFRKNMAKMCFKMDEKFTLFLMLGVTVRCYTPVLHLKTSDSGIKKPFVSKGLI